MDWSEVQATAKIIRLWRSVAELSAQARGINHPLTLNALQRARKHEHTLREYAFQCELDMTREHNHPWLRA